MKGIIRYNTEGTFKKVINIIKKIDLFVTLKYPISSKIFKMNIKQKKIKKILKKFDRKVFAIY